MTDATNQTPRSGIARRIFLDHPASVEETYFQHMGFALRFAFWLAVAAAAALVHAVVPALCEKTASGIVRRLFARIENRGAQ